MEGKNILNLSLFFTALTTIGIFTAMNPLIGVPLIVGGLMMTKFGNFENLNDTTKRKIGENFSKIFEEKSDSLAEEIDNKVKGTSNEFRNKVEISLSNEIQRITEQINAAVAAKQEGSQRVGNEQKVLAEIKQRVQSTSGNLIECISDLAVLR